MYRDKELYLLKKIYLYVSCIFFLNWIAPKVSISTLYIFIFNIE